MMIDHPQRLALHNEVHARPPEPMQAPQVISRVVMWVDRVSAQASRDHLAQLLHDHHLPAPDAHTNHVRMDLGSFRMRWELHTEFVSWTFMRPVGADVFAHGEPMTAIQAVPHKWLAQLPGECLARLHVWLLPSSTADIHHDMPKVLHDDTLVASTVAEGHGEVYTDFQLHPDGYSRIVLLTGSLTPRRQGRLVQQLMEIETYRMAALLGVPAARQASHALADAEREFAALANAIRNASSADEAVLLDRLTRLAGEVEGQYASTHSRFSATRAYFVLVDRRITSENFTTFITASDMVYGHMSAQWMVEKLGGKGKVAIITGQLGASNLNERIDGVKEALAAYPDIEIVAVEGTEDDLAKAVSVTEAILRGNPDLAGIFGMSQVGGPAVAKVLAQQEFADRKGAVAVFGDRHTAGRSREGHRR